MEPPARAADPQFPAVLLLRDLDLEAASSCEGEQVAVETANRQPGGERILIGSRLGVLVGSHHESEGGSAVTALRAETTQDVLPVATTTDRSVAGRRNGPGGDGSASEDSDRQAGDGESGLLGEHSYSRQNTDKDQLWSKIAGLHLKITELEKREEETMRKMGSLEALIAHLKREGALREEKQKALEDYFTSVFL